MPMSFPTMDSLKFAAEVWKFRQPEKDESEAAYRTALANHVQPKDMVEAHEIRTGKGWDEWSDSENKEALYRGMLGNTR